MPGEIEYRGVGVPAPKVEDRIGVEDRGLPVGVKERGLFSFLNLVEESVRDFDFRVFLILESLTWTEKK